MLEKSLFRRKLNRGIVRNRGGGGSGGGLEGEEGVVGGLIRTV